MSLRTLFIYLTATVALPICAQMPADIDWQKAERVTESNLSKQYYAAAPTPSWVGKSSFATYSVVDGGSKKIWLVKAQFKTSVATAHML